MASRPRVWSHQIGAPTLALIDKAAGWPQSDLGQIVAIQLNQSGGDPYEVGWDYQGHTVFDSTGQPPATGQPWSSYDTGISQINSSSMPGATAQNNLAGTVNKRWITEMQNPLSNAVQALEMFKARGWQPWSGDASLGPNHVNLATGESAASQLATTTQTQAAEIISSGGGGVPAGFHVGQAISQVTGEANAVTYQAANAVVGSTSPAAALFSGLSVPWVRDLLTGIGSEMLRVLEVVAGGLLMGFGIVLLARAMSSPSQDAGEQLRGAWKDATLLAA